MTIHVKHLEQWLAHSKCSISVVITIRPNPVLQAQTTMVKNCQCFSIYSLQILSFFYKNPMKWATQNLLHFIKGAKVWRG